MQDEEQLENTAFEESEGTAAGRGPQAIELPAQPEVLREARSLVGNGDVRINRLAEVIGIDPIITLELLKIANATFYTGDRPPITNVRTAVVRLGSGAIIEILDQLKSRQPLQPHPVAMQFELLRTLATQVSVVSQMIAFVASRDSTEVAQTAGLMSYMGHMVACAHLGERYLDIANSKHYASLAYKLLQEYSFDVRAVQLSYLRMRGIPQEIFYALDRDMQCKTTAQANLRFTVQGATELVEAAHSGKWDKYAPYQPLPTKSALRLLKISEHHYVELYNTVEGYLRKPALPRAQGGVEEASAEERSESSITVSERQPEQKFEEAPQPSHVSEVLSQETNYLTHDPDGPQEDSTQLSEDGKKVIGLIQEISSKCKTTQDLLSAVMTLLISDGPYSRAALLLVGDERQSANIHTAVGDGFDQNPDLAVVDPLSPLALCLTKINSFNAQGLEDTLSPFGITSYAVSPVKMKSKQPVVLYADCGVDRSLPMEARKIFRLVVGLLNTILPSLPGGLPKRNYKPSQIRSSFEKESTSNV